MLELNVTSKLAEMWLKPGIGYKRYTTVKTDFRQTAQCHYEKV